MGASIASPSSTRAAPASAVPSTEYAVMVSPVDNAAPARADW